MLDRPSTPALALLLVCACARAEAPAQEDPVPDTEWSLVQLVARSDGKARQDLAYTLQATEDAPRGVLALARRRCRVDGRTVAEIVEAPLRRVHSAGRRYEGEVSFGGVAAGVPCELALLRVGRAREDLVARHCIVDDEVRAGACADWVHDEGEAVELVAVGSSATVWFRFDAPRSDEFELVARVTGYSGARRVSTFQPLAAATYPYEPGDHIAAGSIDLPPEADAVEVEVAYGQGWGAGARDYDAVALACLRGVRSEAGLCENEPAPGEQELSLHEASVSRRLREPHAGETMIMDRVVVHGLLMREQAGVALEAELSVRCDEPFRDRAPNRFLHDFDRSKGSWGPPEEWTAAIGIGQSIPVVAEVDVPRVAEGCQARVISHGEVIAQSPV